MHSVIQLFLTRLWQLPVCFLLLVKLEKAEILEKTISYIKKLQEITGKQELNSERKNDQPKPQGESQIYSKDWNNDNF